MQYRPTAAELLDEIAKLLEDEVLAAVPEHIQHRVRVAANLARILQREVALAPAAQIRERELVAGLLAGPVDSHADLMTLRTELAAQLRSSAPADEDATWKALVEITKADLAIAKPGHDAWAGDE